MYIGTSINDSPVITGVATSAITDGAFKAVKFDNNGGIVLAGAGENAIGILISGTPATVAAGDDVTIQIKDIGLAKASAAIVAGAEIAVAAGGLVATAVAGNFVIGFALEAAGATNDIIKVQIVKIGQKPALTLAALSDVAITTPTDGQALKYDTTTSKWLNEADATA